MHSDRLAWGQVIEPVISWDLILTANCSKMMFLMVTMIMHACSFGMQPLHLLHLWLSAPTML